MSGWAVILITLSIVLPFIYLGIGFYYGVYYQYYNKKLRDAFANLLAKEARDGK